MQQPHIVPAQHQAAQVVHLNKPADELLSLAPGTTKPKTTKRVLSKSVEMHEAQGVRTLQVIATV